MKVLITGGSGYLGQATIRALQRHGHQAVALARSDDADRVVTNLGATVLRGGLTDLDVLHKTAIDVDAAIHLAQDYGPETAGVAFAQPPQSRTVSARGRMCTPVVSGSTGTPKVSSTRRHRKRPRRSPRGAATTNAAFLSAPVLAGIPFW